MFKIQIKSGDGEWFDLLTITFATRSEAWDYLHHLVILLDDYEVRIVPIEQDG